MKSPEPFNADVGAALLDFNGEAVPYCQGISDADATSTSTETWADRRSVLNRRTRKCESQAEFFDSVVESLCQILRGCRPSLYP